MSTTASETAEAAPETRVSRSATGTRFTRSIGIATVLGVIWLTGFGLFASFLAVTQFVQVPAAAGYGFGASTLEAAVVYLLVNWIIPLA